MKTTQFMTWLKPFLVLSIVCSFALTATAQNYYPANVGNIWVFLSTDGAEQLTYTLEEPEASDIEGLILLNIANQAIGTDTSVVSKYFITTDGQGGLTLHQSAVDQGAFGIAHATFDPPVVFFPPDLPLGKKWEIVTETELQLVGAATSTSTLEIVAIEDVETAAGVFKDCVKVEINRKSVTRLGVTRETFYQWLAPDVGPVKFLDSQEILYELESYSLVEPPAADMQPPEETPDEGVADAETPAEPTDEGMTDAETPAEPTDEDMTDAETPAEPTDEGMTDAETPAEPTDEGMTDAETPAEPTDEEPMMPKAYSFDISLQPGLNMISIPLMPEEPYTAKSLAGMLDATLVIRLNTTSQNFVAYTSLDEGDGFGIEGGMGYIVNTPDSATATFTGKAWSNQTEAEEAPAAPALATAKNTWAFVVTSDIRDRETGARYILVAENLRTGTIATEAITSDVKRSAAVWADLNRKSVVEAGDKLKIALYDERGNIVSGPFQRTVSTADIRNAFLNLQLTVGDVRPKDTILAQNYPNPFNPETWIPYQLSKSAEVSIHIHNIAGHRIRTLHLGQKPVGSYMTPSTAAYWDGKNAAGEPVASGIYFYTLHTADFSATRRMVILK